MRNLIAQTRNNTVGFGLDRRQRTRGRRSLVSPRPSLSTLPVATPVASEDTSMSWTLRLVPFRGIVCVGNWTCASETQVVAWREALNIYRLKSRRYGVAESTA